MNVHRPFVLVTTTTTTTQEQQQQQQQVADDCKIHQQRWEKFLERFKIPYEKQQQQQQQQQAEEQQQEEAFDMDDKEKESCRFDGGSRKTTTTAKTTTTTTTTTLPYVRLGNERYTTTEATLERWKELKPNNKTYSLISAATASNNKNLLLLSSSDDSTTCCGGPRKRSILLHRRSTSSTLPLCLEEEDDLSETEVLLDDSSSQNHNITTTMTTMMEDQDPCSSSESFGGGGGGGRSFMAATAASSSESDATSTSTSTTMTFIMKTTTPTGGGGGSTLEGAQEPGNELWLEPPSSPPQQQLLLPLVSCSSEEEDASSTGWEDDDDYSSTDDELEELLASDPTASTLWGGGGGDNLSLDGGRSSPFVSGPTDVASKEPATEDGVACASASAAAAVPRSGGGNNTSLLQEGPTMMSDGSDRWSATYSTSTSSGDDGVLGGGGGGGNKKDLSPSKPIAMPPLVPCIRSNTPGPYLGRRDLNLLDDVGVGGVIKNNSWDSHSTDGSLCNEDLLNGIRFISTTSLSSTTTTGSSGGQSDGGTGRRSMTTSTPPTTSGSRRLGRGSGATIPRDSFSTWSSTFSDDLDTASFHDGPSFPSLPPFKAAATTGSSTSRRRFGRTKSSSQEQDNHLHYRVSSSSSSSSSQHPPRRPKTMDRRNSHPGNKSNVENDSNSLPYPLPSDVEKVMFEKRMGSFRCKFKHEEAEGEPQPHPTRNSNHRASFRSIKDSVPSVPSRHPTPVPSSFTSESEEEEDSTTTDDGSTSKDSVPSFPSRRPTPVPSSFITESEEDNTTTGASDADDRDEFALDLSSHSSKGSVDESPGACQPPPMIMDRARSVRFLDDDDEEAEEPLEAKATTTTVKKPTNDARQRQLKQLHTTFSSWACIDVGDLASSTHVKTTDAGGVPVLVANSDIPPNFPTRDVSACVDDANLLMEGDLLFQKSASEPAVSSTDIAMAPARAAPYHQFQLAATISPDVSPPSMPKRCESSENGCHHHHHHHHYYFHQYASSSTLTSVANKEDGLRIPDLLADTSESERKLLSEVSEVLEPKAEAMIPTTPTTRDCKFSDKAAESDASPVMPDRSSSDEGLDSAAAVVDHCRRRPRRRRYRRRSSTSTGNKRPITRRRRPSDTSPSVPLRLASNHSAHDADVESGDASASSRSKAVFRSKRSNKGRSGTEDMPLLISYSTSPDNTICSSSDISIGTAETPSSFVYNSCPQTQTQHSPPLQKKVPPTTSWKGQEQKSLPNSSSNISKVRSNIKERRSSTSLLDVPKQVELSSPPPLRTTVSCPVISERGTECKDAGGGGGIIAAAATSVAMGPSCNHDELEGSYQSTTTVKTSHLTTTETSFAPTGKRWWKGKRWLKGKRWWKRNDCPKSDSIQETHGMAKEEKGNRGNSASLSVGKSPVVAERSSLTFVGDPSTSSEI